MPSRESCVLSLQGDYEAAQLHIEAAFRIYQERGSTVWGADPLCALAENAMRQGHLAAARAHLQEAAARTAGSGIRWLKVLVGYFSGLLAFYEGEPDHAAALLEEAAELAREDQIMPDLARSPISLGRARQAQGDVVGAAARLQEGLRLYQQMNHTLGAVTALEALAGLALATHPEQAARWLGAAETIRIVMGTPLPPIERPAYERHLAAIHADLDERAWAQIWAEGQAMSLETAIAYAIQDDE